MKKLKLHELNRLSPEDYQEIDKFPVTVVLDNVRSAYNVGAVFRTSDAFKIERLYLCGITGRPPHKEIHKTAIGATETVDWTYYKTTLEAVQALQAAGYLLVAVEQAVGSIPLQAYEFAPNRSYALIFGNEVQGVGQEVMDLVEVCLEIPQSGTKHSLNIAVSAGVVLWEYYSQQLKG